MIALGALVVVALAAIIFAFARGDKEAGPPKPVASASKHKGGPVPQDDSIPVSGDLVVNLSMSGGAPVDRMRW